MARLIGAAGRLFRHRRPDLGRLIHSAVLLAQDSAAAAWIDGQFGLIEGAADWLECLGGEMCDACRVTARQPGYSRAVLGVQCIRAVSRVYGFGGPLPGRLSELSAVLSGAGWASAAPESAVAPPRLRGLALAGLDPPARLLWGPPGALAGDPGPLPAWLRPGGSSVPIADRSQLVLEAAWERPDRPLQGVLRLQTVGPASGTDTPVYRVIDCSPATVADLAGRALARHSHVLGIRISADYYRNPDVSRSACHEAAQPRRRRHPGPGRAAVSRRRAPWSARRWPGRGRARPG
jgi:hypothetical protein